MSAAMSAATDGLLQVSAGSAMGVATGAGIGSGDTLGGTLGSISTPAPATASAPTRRAAHVRSKRAPVASKDALAAAEGAPTGPVSGFGDGASAADNFRDAFCGVPARRSTYKDAPGGSVCLSTKLAQLLVEVAQVGVIDVNSLAGSSHSWHQAHYEGLAVDIGSLNDEPLDIHHRELALKVIEACRRGGATQIFNANMDCGELCDAHHSWVHCRVAAADNGDTGEDSGKESSSDPNSHSCGVHRRPGGAVRRAPVAK
jgi:hypothetical protein